MNIESVRVSIIIPAHNESKNLPKLFESFKKLKLRKAPKILLVDVGSTDDTAKIGQSYGALVISTGRVYPGVARNLGAAKASGDVLVFLDGDVEITEKWAERFIERLSIWKDKPAAITGSPYAIPVDAGWIERNWFSVEYKSEPKYINGGNLVVPAAVFDRLEGFDESLPTGEDFDFCQRAKNAGILVQIDHYLKAIHNGYPRNVKDFLLREAWHGKGDLVSAKTFFNSKIAIFSTIFIGSTAFILGLLVAGRPEFLPVPAAIAIGLPIALATRRWRHIGGPREIFLAIPIALLYLTGRAMGILFPSSLVAKLRSRTKQTESQSQHSVH